jgi:hypothetical protein
MSAETTAPAPLSLGNGLLMTGFIIVAVGGWIFLGPKLGVASAFASFTFLWYWATIENAEVKGLAPALIGALTGIGLAALFRYLPVQFPAWGLAAAYGATIMVLFCVVMNWAHFVFNGATMLMVTVLGAPAILMNANFLELVQAVVFGAAYFVFAVALARLYVRWRHGAPAKA